MQFKEEDFYYDGKVIDINLIEEEERWNITENTLRKAIVKYEEKDDWTVLQNPLNEQNQFDYQQLEMKIYHIEFNLPFFQDLQEDSSDEERSNSINDILDNLFSKERIDKKKKAVKKKLESLKRNYLTRRKASNDDNEGEKLISNNIKENNEEDIVLEETVASLSVSETNSPMVNSTTITEQEEERTKNREEQVDIVEFI
ncbi:hypothetical protein ABK040_009960 [Willaertia magna]